MMLPNKPVRPTSYAEWKRYEAVFQYSVPFDPLSHLRGSKHLTALVKFKSNFAWSLPHSPGQVTSKQITKPYVVGECSRSIEPREIAEVFTPISRKSVVSTSQDSGSNPVHNTQMWGSFSPSQRSEYNQSEASMNLRPQSAPGYWRNSRLDSSNFLSSASFSLTEQKSIVSIFQDCDGQQKAEFAGYRQELNKLRHKESRNCNNRLLDCEDLVSNFDVLKSSMFARIIPEDCLRVLAQHSCCVDCNAGKTLCVQGKRSDSAFVIVGGELVLLVERNIFRGQTETKVVRRLSNPGDSVAENSLLTGESCPTTIRCATASRLVQISVRAMQALIKYEPHAANMFAAVHAEYQNPASLLVKVIGVSGLPKMGDGDCVNTIEVSAQHKGGKIVKTSQPLNPVVVYNNHLPINCIFEIKITEQDSIISVRFLSTPDRAEQKSKSFGMASFPFSTVQKTRTMSAELILDTGGAVTVVVSVRGMYTVDEQELLEWLDDGAADLPMLLKCGIQSVAALEALSHSELQAIMEEHGLTEQMRMRISSKFLSAKAGQGFLSPIGRNISSKILRFYNCAGYFAPDLNIGKGSGDRSSGKWRSEMLAGCIANHAEADLEEVIAVDAEMMDVAQATSSRSVLNNSI